MVKRLLVALIPVLASSLVLAQGTTSLIEIKPGTDGSALKTENGVPVWGTDLNQGAFSIGDSAFVNFQSGVDSDTCGYGGTCSGGADDGLECQTDSDCTSPGTCEDVAAGDAPCKTASQAIANMDFAVDSQSAGVTRGSETRAIRRTSIQYALGNMTEVGRCLNDFSQSCAPAAGADATCTGLSANAAADELYGDGTSGSGSHCAAMIRHARMCSFSSNDGDPCAGTCSHTGERCYQDRDCPAVGICSGDGTTLCLYTSDCTAGPGGTCDFNAFASVNYQQCTNADFYGICGDDSSGRSSECRPRPAEHICPGERNATLRGDVRDPGLFVFDYTASAGVTLTSCELARAAGSGGDVRAMWGRRGPFASYANRYYQLSGSAGAGASGGDIGRNLIFGVFGHGNSQGGLWDSAGFLAASTGALGHWQTADRVGLVEEVDSTRFGTAWGCATGLCDTDSDFDLSDETDPETCFRDSNPGGCTTGQCLLNYCASGDFGWTGIREAQTNASGIYVSPAPGVCLDGTDCYFDNTCDDLCTGSGTPLPCCTGTDTGTCTCERPTGQRQNVQFEHSVLGVRLGNDSTLGDCAGGANVGLPCQVDADCPSSTCAQDWQSFTDSGLGTCDPAVNASNARELCAVDWDCPGNTTPPGDSGACADELFNQHHGFWVGCFNLTDAEGCFVGAKLTELTVKPDPLFGTEPEYSIYADGADVEFEGHVNWAKATAVNGGKITPGTQFGSIYDFLLLHGQASDPSGSNLVDDMVWFNTTTNELKWRSGGTTYVFTPQVASNVHNQDGSGVQEVVQWTNTTGAGVKAGAYTDLNDDGTALFGEIHIEEITGSSGLFRVKLDTNSGMNTGIVIEGHPASDNTGSHAGVGVENPASAWDIGNLDTGASETRARILSPSTTTVAILELGEGTNAATLSYNGSSDEAALENNTAGGGKIFKFLVGGDEAYRMRVSGFGNTTACHGDTGGTNTECAYLQLRDAIGTTLTQAHCDSTGIGFLAIESGDTTVPMLCYCGDDTDATDPQDWYCIQGTKVENGGCTASGVPWGCCTGSGTGTC